MAKRPSNNFEQGVASSNKNMKATTSNQLPSYGKQYRQFQYSIYQSTNFEAHKNEFFIVAEKIRTQRLMEHMGRYKSKEEKQIQLNIFKVNFLRLKELLFLMSKQAEKYKNMMMSNGSSKQIRSTNVSCDYEISFRKKIRRDLKDIETWWIELFCEGSLKRLIPVLNLLRIVQDEVDFGLDITQWHLETEYKFASQQKGQGCCCG